SSGRRRAGRGTVMGSSQVASSAMPRQLPALPNIMQRERASESLVREDFFGGVGNSDIARLHNPNGRWGHLKDAPAPTRGCERWGARRAEPRVSAGVPNAPLSEQARRSPSPPSDFGARLPAA